MLESTWNYSKCLSSKSYYWYYCYCFYYY